MKMNLNNVVFQQKGLATNQPDAFKTYCRIMIAVDKGNPGDNPLSTDYEDLDTETICVFQNMASQSAGGFEVLGKPNVKWIRIEDTYAIITDALI